MTSRFVVITGGPGSGKTSLIEHLASLGYAAVPEGAIQIIEELNQRYGLPGQIAWRQGHMEEFQRLILERQVALESACSATGNAFAFCDRGRPDLLAYARLTGLTLADEQRALVEERRYFRVFLLDTLSQFETRPATGRTSDRQRSLQIHKLLDAAYRTLGYDAVPVPELAIEARARVVLSDLGLLASSSALTG